MRKLKEALKILRLAKLDAQRVYKRICHPKKAAAISNTALGNLNTKIGKQIINVCDEIISESLMIISLYQFGRQDQELKQI